MKRIFAALVCISALLTVLCACSKGESDVNYIITFDCENEKTEWKFETENDGIVSVATEPTNDTNGNKSYSFILESVGEGETNIKFSCFDKENNELLKTVEYAVKVNKDYAITAKLISEEVLPGSEKTDVEIKSAADAENLVRDKMAKENPENEGNMFFETKKQPDGEYIVRVFETALDENGKTVRRYVKSYVINDKSGLTGEAKENFKDKEICFK